MNHLPAGRRFTWNIKLYLTIKIDVYLAMLSVIKFRPHLRFTTAVKVLQTNAIVLSIVSKRNFVNQFDTHTHTRTHTHAHARTCTYKTCVLLLTYYLQEFAIRLYLKLSYSNAIIKPCETHLIWYDGKQRNITILKNNNLKQQKKKAHWNTTTMQVFKCQF